MTSSPGFLLLNLPQVAQAHILNVSHPSELVTLSFCSRKMYRFVQVYRSKSIKWRVSVNNGNNPRVSLKCGRTYDVFRLQVVSQKIERRFKRSNVLKVFASKIPTIHNSQEMMIICANQVVGIKSIANYICDLFNLDIEYIFFGRNTLTLIDWINSRQKTPVKIASVGCMLNSSDSSPVPTGHFNKILTKCRPTDFLIIQARAPSTFQYTETLHNSEYFIIFFGHWLTIEHLMAMDSVQVMIGNSKITSRDFNTFLKHWLAGGCPRLKCLSLDIKNWNMDDVVRDLDVTEFEKVRDYNSPNGTKYTLDDGYDIKRADDVIATVNRDLTGTLVLCVWPETGSPDWWKSS